MLTQSRLALILFIFIGLLKSPHILADASYQLVQEGNFPTLPAFFARIKGHWRGKGQVTQIQGVTPYVAFTGEVDLEFTKSGGPTPIIFPALWTERKRFCNTEHQETPVCTETETRYLLLSIQKIIDNPHPQPGDWLDVPVAQTSYSALSFMAAPFIPTDNRNLNLLVFNSLSKDGKTLTRQTIQRSGEEIISNEFLVTALIPENTGVSTSE